MNDAKVAPYHRILYEDYDDDEEMWKKREKRLIFENFVLHKYMSNQFLYSVSLVFFFALLFESITKNFVRGD